jgi:hypothetical protein
MWFNVGNKFDGQLQLFMQDIANSLKYTERTGMNVTGEYSVMGDDVWPFYHGHSYPERFCDHAIEFDRSPATSMITGYTWAGYHRDGNNHTVGDVFSDINDTLFRIDCEVISEIIYRLAIPKIQVNITRPIENSFYLGNRWLSALQKRTVICGPIEITADVDSDAGIDRVEFYVDNKLKKTDTEEPFNYRWMLSVPFKHLIKVVAYDTNGNYGDDEIYVWNG